MSPTVCCSCEKSSFVSIMAKFIISACTTQKNSQFPSLALLTGSCAEGMPMQALHCAPACICWLQVPSQLLSFATHSYRMYEFMHMSRLKRRTARAVPVILVPMALCSLPFSCACTGRAAFPFHVTFPLTQRHSGIKLCVIQTSTALLFSGQVQQGG